MYGKFSEKLTFLTPWYAHVRTGNFAYVLNGWPLYWNQDSIFAQSFFKKFPLSPYISLHIIELVGIPETYLDSVTSLASDNLEIRENNLLRVDIVFHINRGGVCAYYKNSPVLKLNDGRKLD